MHVLHLRQVQQGSHVCSEQDLPADRQDNQNGVLLPGVHERVPSDQPNLRALTRAQGHRASTPHINHPRDQHLPAQCKDLAPPPLQSIQQLP